jgi:Flp pilus assembly pilin Flp
MVPFDPGGQCLSIRRDGPFSRGPEYVQPAGITDCAEEVKYMTNFLMLTQVRLLNAYASLRDREEGQGMTEYAVLVGAVIAMVLAVIGVLTGKITTFINGLTL